MASAFKLNKKDGIATLIFDLPGEKVNKLSGPVLLELEGILDNLAKQTDIKLLVIESAKPGIFIAGADIEEIKDLRVIADAETKVKRGQDVLGKIEKLPFPSLAVINGACMGGGCELVLCCTYRVAIENKKNADWLAGGESRDFSGFWRHAKVAENYRAGGITEINSCRKNN